MRARTAVAPKWLSRKLACEIYAVSLTRLDELIAAGSITAVHDGKRRDGHPTRIKVSVASLDAWADSLPEA